MAKRLPNLKGNVYGELTVLDLHSNKDGKKKWSCKCSCGNNTIVSQDHLRSGHTKSCGCLWVKTINTHGLRKSPLYRRYNAMHQRCNNPNHKGYSSYGGRGIKLLWDNFEDFYKDMADTYKEGLSLDRIDVNGNYCKENCRWATSDEQYNNKRKSHLITYKNRTLSVAQWARELNMPENFLRARLLNGWSFENAISKPKNYRGFYKKGDARSVSS